MLNPKDYRPKLDGQDAMDFERRVRLKALESAHSTADFKPVFSPSNREEELFADAIPTSFTKGLPHDLMGQVSSVDYEAFVTSLRQPPDPDGMGIFHTTSKTPEFLFEKLDKSDQAFKTPKKRKWESPLGGLMADLQGPAPVGVAQPPAPSVGSSELTAELAEVYAMALLRDISFKDLETPTTPVQAGGVTFTVQNVIDELNNLPWFDDTKTPMGVTPGGFAPAPLNRLEVRRRNARFGNGVRQLTTANLFRGSTAGARTGPYVSQLMLLGAKSLGPDDGLIRFGAQTINQRIQPDIDGLDYMTDFLEWRDVQNGANFENVTPTGLPSRFVTTPRDMATYVHYDQLYQAYFNAALLLIDAGLSPDSGFPNANQQDREGFATWGGPHLLALLAEVSSRALRAVRRQKFQIHRRGRPEQLAAKLTLYANGHGSTLGQAQPHFERMYQELQTFAPNLLTWINLKNQENNDNPPSARDLKATAEAGKVMTPSITDNYLLPMAFAEGSPMHPAYGAGHATVAGACVTVLKAFFNTVSPTGEQVPWSDLGLPDQKIGDGTVLGTSGEGPAETVTGELDKLAANISIGRNMGGVHYYTDYYESLRMGERIAALILYQNMLTSPEPAAPRFFDFDGRLVTLSAKPRRDIRFPDSLETGADISVVDPGSMTTVDAGDWWVENLPEPAGSG